MQIKKKINIKRYLVLNSISLVFWSFLVQSRIEFLAIFIVALATGINHYFLFSMVQNLILKGHGPESSNPGKIMTYILIKMGVLVGSFLIGVHLIGFRIIMALFNYVLQIFMLYFSLEKGDVTA